MWMGRRRRMGALRRFGWRVGWAECFASGVLTEGEWLVAGGFAESLYLVVAMISNLA